MTAARKAAKKEKMIEKRHVCPTVGCKAPTASRGLSCDGCVTGANVRRGGGGDPVSASLDAAPVVPFTAAENAMWNEAERSASAPIGFKDDGQGDSTAPLKPRPELLPGGPILAISLVAAWGARKYTRGGQDGAGNWMHVVGGRLRYLGAAMRHLFAYTMGQRVDDESGLPTLAHAGCDLLFAFWHDMEEQKKQ